MNTTPLHPRRAARLATLAAAVLAGTTVVAYSGVSLLSAHILTRPSNLPARTDPLSIGQAREWSTRTEDGLTLRGWFYPGKGRHLVVAVHGMSSKWDELRGIGHDLNALGYDVLLFDLRGHGRSDPARLSMGRFERADLRAVLNWAKQSGYTPNRIGWLGYSMGASTILMEGVENPEIQVAILDSPYGNLPELLDTQLTDHSGLPKAFNPGILLAARYAYGIRTDDLVPIRLAKEWGRRPLLLIHGEADAIVPVEHAWAIARAAGSSCRLITLPGVEHTGSYNADPPRYVAWVDEFFRKNLAP